MILGVDEREGCSGCYKWVTESAGDVGDDKMVGKTSMGVEDNVRMPERVRGEVEGEPGKTVRVKVNGWAGTGEGMRWERVSGVGNGDVWGGAKITVIKKVPLPISDSETKNIKSFYPHSCVVVRWCAY